MAKYIIKRILLILLTTFIILSLTFILMKLLPTVPPPGRDEVRIQFYEMQVSYGYMYKIASKEPGNLGGYIYKTYPVLQQYFVWLQRIVLHFDWGTSTHIAPNQETIDIILRKLPYSLRINVIALIISVPLGFLLGILAALKKNKKTDHVISTGVMVFISVPSFVTITLLIAFFAYQLGWLPSQWPSDASPMGWKTLGYVIPVSALCFGTIAGFARYTRAELCEVMSSEFLLLARTKGLTRSQTITRHALRNSMVPIIPMIIGEFIGILGGSMILERLYGIPGIGNLFVDAISAKDYNVIMVDMAVYTLIGLFATLFVDLSYGIVDPRIRMGAKK